MNQCTQYFHREEKNRYTQLELIFVPFGKSILDAQRLTNDGQSKILQGVSWLSNVPEKKTRMTKTAPSVKHETRIISWFETFLTARRKKTGA